MSEKNLVLLDGGTATELVNLGHPDLEDHPLWSAIVLQRSPDSILEVHKNFISAGSDIILTVSYQATVSGFMKHADLTEHDAIQLLQLSVKLAKQASEKYSEAGKTAKVAGSLGPVGVQFADGSEYTGSYVDDMDENEMQDMHRPQIKALLEAGVDLLAFETVPALKEASAIVNLLEKEFPDARAWLTFSCKNGTETCYGDSFYSAVKAVHQSDSIVAVGVNCTDPVFVTSLLNSIQSLNLDKPVIVKPNSGEVWDAKVNNWTDKHKCVDISSKVEEWIQNGARWIGGCCRVYADSIAEIRQILDKQEQK